MRPVLNGKNDGLVKKIYFCGPSFIGIGEF